MAQVTSHSQKSTPPALVVEQFISDHVKAGGVLLLGAILLWVMGSRPSGANPFLSSTTPGMVMANITFDINSPDEDHVLSPSQMRLKLMSSSGKDLIYVETSFTRFDPTARFAYDKNTPYKRPADYPLTRDIPIIDKPTTYKVAIERYKRAIHIYKNSRSISSKAQAKSYMHYCYQQALALYKREKGRGGKTQQNAVPFNASNRTHKAR